VGARIVEDPYAFSVPCASAVLASVVTPALEPLDLRWGRGRDRLVSNRLPG
jgi:hypothetical protein